MSLISIVIPTYNHAHFLEKALQSVFDQTYTNWEIIIVDNHSTDNTVEIINKFKDPRINHFLIHNQGVIAASRNFGIQKAKGDWIAFLDSDDYWYFDKLVTIINTIKTNVAVDVLCTDEVLVNLNSGKSQILKYGPFTKHFYKTMLLYGNRLSTSATIVKHSFLKENSLLFNESPDFVTVEDYDLWLNLARLNAKFFFINKIMGAYVIHSSNSSTQLARHEKNYKKLMLEHIYTIQQFETRPDRLWKRIMIRFKIAEIKKIISKRYFLRAFGMTVHLMFFNPINMMCYFIRKFNFKRMNLN